MNKRIFDDLFLENIEREITNCTKNNNELSVDMLADIINNQHNNIKPCENQLIDIYINIEFANNFLNAYKQYKLKFRDYKNAIDKSLMYAYNKSLLIK
jgi:hypothetical protein